MMNLRSNFKNVYGYDGAHSYFSPGRVNLIGEHLDYNGGHVLPFAINLGTYGVYSLRKDDKVNVYSNNFKDLNILSFNLNNLTKDNTYASYIKGCYKILKDKYGSNITRGMDIYLDSDLPIGSGLSSSASLELLILNILNDEFNLGLSKVELSLLGKDVENLYMGLSSGIMDQFAVSLGKKDMAILLNTNTLEYRYIPFDLGDNKLIVINTNKPRKLIESKYNERKSECDKAREILKKEILSSTLDEIEKLPNPINRRARHVLTEESRVLSSLSDLSNIGDNLKKSHMSLKDDYEVTGIELDTIALNLNKIPDVLGSRMTGAGFGGSLIALFKPIKDEEIDSIMKDIGKIYSDTTGLNLTYYRVIPSDGTGRID